MISSFYGYRINLSSLRKKIVLDAQGMNLKQMMELASELNLSSRALQCNIDEISQLKIPCILHWNLDHFVVLTGITKKNFYINDPVFGKRRLTIEQFSEAYTGIALELTPTANFKKQDVRTVMKINQLWIKITGLKRSLMALFSLSIVMQTTALLSPYYMQWVIDNVLLSNDKPLLMVLALGFGLLMLIQTTVSAFRSWLIIRFSSTFNLQTGENVFHHLIRLPMDYFEKRHVGDIVSRFGSLNAIREMLTTGLVEAVIDGLMAIVVLAMMYIYSPLLATLVLCVVILSFIIQVLFYYPNKRITEESIVADAKEDSTFLESIRAIQTIKLFSHEASRQSIWLNRYADVINTDIRLGKLTIAEESINSLLFGLESILVVYFGALIVIEGNLTVGMLLAFIAYKGQFISSITALIDNVLSIKLLSLHLERLSDITLQEREQYKIKQAKLPNIIEGHFRVENLSFRYSDNSEWVIKDLSFEIKAGESIAITGRSGSGKTTLMKVLLGLLKPSSGHIYLDDVDISDLPLTEYRHHLGTVMQNDMLLSGTLAENITFFDSNYDEDKLIRCCNNACILDEIQALPMRFHSLVGDMGSSFSGGQLQRIFLARALYRNPKILFLDESTSHLDQQNEYLINYNLNKLKMTKIFIAHRKETIKSVDRVISLG
ncbi:peptidase domain-containing ABC transporter [Photobacterium lutimaris]|uniref:peptidase domain-containing ABC transporter n=1 Tax=Photobacterium lutimaris TaxID=388278 RepID=UPI0010D2E0A0|nr:peptidase domain-containing ABC transporter [Photobacterium lutimaris]TDR76020.1 colicin V processing peptidase [Photobacterium lutimaris]